LDLYLRFRKIYNSKKFNLNIDIGKAFIIIYGSYQLVFSDAKSKLIYLIILPQSDDEELFLQHFSIEGAGELTTPRGIVMHGTSLWVADASDNNIKKYSWKLKKP